MPAYTRILPSIIFHVVPPALTKILYRYLPSDKLSVAVVPNEILNFPSYALEDTDFSFIPTVIEPDIKEHYINIDEEEDNTFSVSLKDEYLNTIASITPTHGTPLPSIKKKYDLPHHI